MVENLAKPDVVVVGAGMAGLSAAVDLTLAGARVTLLEGAPQAGGRCRSYFDRVIDAEIDNGNHLVMSGNDKVMRFLDIIGARDELIGPEEARYAFVDLDPEAVERTFTVDVNKGRIPHWVFDKSRRVPGTTLGDHLAGLRMLFAGADATVAGTIKDRGPLWRGFWEPLTLAAVNTAPEKAAMSMLRIVLMRTFVKGGEFALPRIVRKTLARTFVDPAMAWLQERGADIRLSTRVTSIEIKDGKVDGLVLGDGERLMISGGVVLATPPQVTGRFLPDLTVPEVGDPILNAHFRVEGGPFLPSDLPMIGLLGSPVHWVFEHGPILSITVSAADDLIDQPNDVLEPLLWGETAKALGLPANPQPVTRIVKEKRATFRQTPDNLKRRPKPRIGLDNLCLAGDWVDTGLPATIEGSVTAGCMAATALLPYLKGGEIK